MSAATRTTMAGWLWRNLTPPLALLALVIVAWHAAVLVFKWQPFLVPPPLAVAQEAMANRASLAMATWQTARAALAGLGLSLVVGTFIAFVFSQSAVIRAACYPYAIFLQTVPIVAIAPLIILWFDTGFQSIVVVAFIISLFPIVTNTTDGLLATDPDLQALFRLHGATRVQTLLRLRLPRAVPNLVTGLKISSGLSVIGAIVGEFFAGYGAQQGLGYVITLTSGQLKTAHLFAAIFASTALGLAVFLTVSFVGETLVRRFRLAPD